MSRFDRLEALKGAMKKGDVKEPKKKASKKKTSKKKDMDLNSDGIVDQKDVEILEKVIVEKED